MKTYLLAIVLLGSILSLTGQCFPEGAESCKKTRTLCSLVELNGLSCSTSEFRNTSGPAPLCCKSELGTPSNITWWSFVGDGSEVKVTFDLVSSDCRDKHGLQAGILDNCSNMDDNYGSIGVLDCNSECNLKSFTLRGKTRNCQTYYLWVDGCDADICKFTIYTTGGKAPKLPDNPPPPKVVGRACPGGKVQLCGEDFPSCSPVYIWYMDGKEIKKSRHECIDINLPNDKSPIEVCLKYFLGNGYDPIPLCGEVTKCITIIPEDPPIVNEGVVELCQINGAYTWHGVDPKTVFNGSYYIVKSKDEKDGCMVEYRADSLIYLSTIIGSDRNVLICDKDDLPFVSEDGFKWSSEACDKMISWSGADGCDTSYKLNLSLFLPEVRLSQDCGSCDGFTSLKAKVYYIEPCTNSSISIHKFWLNSALDTVGAGDEIQVNKSDVYSFGMNIKVTDKLNGTFQECIVTDTSHWAISVDNKSIQSAILSGTANICDSVVGQYFIENKMKDICEYDWVIKNGNGTILTKNAKYSTMIDIKWNQKDNVDASVCVTPKAKCHNAGETCFDVGFTPSPQIQDVQFECHPDSASYRIIISTIGGDLSSIQVKDTSGWLAQMMDSVTYRTKWIPEGEKVVLRIFDKNECYVSTLDTSHKCITVWADNPQQTKYELWPNPVHDFINIMGQDLYEMDISFIDIHGNIARSLPIRIINGGVRIDLQNMASGMYFVRLSKYDYREILRFVKL